MSAETPHFSARPRQVVEDPRNHCGSFSKHRSGQVRVRLQMGAQGPRRSCRWVRRGRRGGRGRLPRVSYRSPRDPRRWRRVARDQTSRPRPAVSDAADVTVRRKESGFDREHRAERHCARAGCRLRVKASLQPQTDARFGVISTKGHPSNTCQRRQERKVERQQVETSCRARCTSDMDVSLCLNRKEASRCVSFQSPRNVKLPALHEGCFFKRQNRN